MEYFHLENRNSSSTQRPAMGIKAHNTGGSIMESMWHIVYTQQISHVVITVIISCSICAICQALYMMR